MVKNVIFILKGSKSFELKQIFMWLTYVVPLVGALNLYFKIGSKVIKGSKFKLFQMAKITKPTCWHGQTCKRVHGDLYLPIFGFKTWILASYTATTRTTFILWCHFTEGYFILCNTLPNKFFFFFHGMSNY